MPLHAKSAASRAARRARLWLVTALFSTALLVAAAFTGFALQPSLSDVPDLTELANDAATLVAPSATSAWHWLTRSHEPVGLLLKFVCLDLNGQIDARFVTYAGLGLYLLGLLAVLLLLRRAPLNRLALFALAAGCIGFAPTCAARLPDTLAHAAPWVLGLNFGQILLAAPSRSTARAWVAAGVGAVAVMASTPGLAGTIAVLATTTSRSPGRRDGRPGIVIPHCIVLVLGGTLVGIRMNAVGMAGWMDALASLASWPFASPWAAPVIWLPSIATAIHSLWRAPNSMHRLPFSVLAWWSLFAVVLLAISHQPVSVAAAVLIVSLLANAACAWSWPAPDGTARTVRFVGAWAWTILVAIGLTWRDPMAPPVDSRLESKRSALAAAIRSNEPAALRRMSGSPAESRAAEAIVGDHRLRAILPVSLRPALPLATSAPDGAFREGDAPDLRERDALPIFGTWGNGQLPRDGEFVSEPLTTRFPYVQLRVAGNISSPVAIILRTPDGTEHQPLAAPRFGPDRWRRVNFAAPTGEFRIVAREVDTAGWMAFTAPVEVGTLTRLLGKIPRGWPEVSGWLGLIAAIGLATAIGWRSWRAAGHPSVRPSLPWRMVPWLGLFAYAAYFSQHLDPTAGPNDSGGYLNSAKLMLGGEFTSAPRMAFGTAAGETDVTPYLPITFHARGGRMVPEYPVGWPLEVWCFGKLFGLERGVPMLIMAQLVLAVFLIQRLARCFGLPPPWAWLAAAIVGLSPVYLFEALQPVSDGPALLSVGAAIYWAWLSRDRPAFALLAGIATAAAVMIRPSSLLVAAPVLVALGLRRRQLAYWALAGIPGAVALGWYQQTLYGSWHTTGYGDVSTSFGLPFLPLTLRSYAMWLPELLTPLVLPGLALPLVREVPVRVRWLLFTWAAAFIAFYAVYWCTWDNWYNMRFVLPAFPAMIIAALLTLHAIAQRRGWALFAAQASRRARVATAALVVFALGFLIARTSARNVTYWMHSNHTPGDAAKWAGKNLPANAVVVAKHMTGSLFYYTALTFVRLDHPVVQSPEWYRRVAQTGRPIYAVTCHWEIRGYTWTGGKGSGYPDLPGRWQRVAQLGDGEVHVWRLVQPPPAQ